MEQKLRQIPYYGTLALLAYMPFHIFLSQSLSLITGGLSAWKVAKDVLAVLLLALIVILVAVSLQKGDQKKTFYTYLLLATSYLLLHFLIWAINPHIYRDSAILGTIYNTRLLGYLLIGMGAGLLLPQQFKVEKVIKLVLIVSTIVSLLGILQYFLPKDILAHLGYSLQRGVKPAFFIDDKPDLPRIMSTIRDPNSLGAFLILPITILIYQFFRNSKRRMLIGGLLLLHGLALFLTFSRSAWLAAIVAVAFLLLQQFRKGFWGVFTKYWPIIVGSILLIGSLALMNRHQYVVQNVIEHSDENTKQLGSTSLHVKQIELGLKGIRERPLGHGPGTAGLASVHAPNGGLLTENYYLQIGYEIGILGLILFIAINVLVYLRLLRSRNRLALVLLASFWGYVLMNMLLQTWSNEAVAAQWWLLAGTALMESKL